MKSSAYFSKLDEEATLEKAKALLGDYVLLHRIERRDVISLRSPSMDGMPKSPNFKNTAENSLIEHSSATVVCTEIRHAIDALEREEYRYILKRKFLTEFPDKDDLIMDHIGYSKTQYTKIKKDAIIAFAFQFPPQLEEGNKLNDLLVFKA
ncbi:ArpU family phage packaging/lysis transcriptional regulator [Secundilactobacillus kimchicus]|uniref:Phage transcriptional regulator, ArpU family n=1 Tax=Secundilactobacillus kimchicus JCM 15530 TaxID=1302272 RepID=A0A0R1HMW0_9LACO|nr:ArpU family phage packaging/lysis transcriptional regulator [Secundilactobacillus kimchicus]KRK48174.1 hypothetical protein FC96_GL001911 [Secundilactobacillus kimchicus JCM 15530]MBT9670869.1 transcriptional regulator [Secundilactobacillus kimchicus]